MEQGPTFLQTVHSKPQDTLILTVNKRLSLELSRQHDLQHHDSWETAAILPLTTWMQQIWQQYSEESVLLSPLQESHLWLSIIKQDTDSVIVNSTQTATQAQQAWQLLHQWRLPLSCLVDSHNQDVDTFFRWANSFNQTCKKNDWVCAAALPHRVHSILKQTNDINLPARISLRGFDEISPAFQHLFDLLETQYRVEITFPDTIKRHNAIQLRRHTEPQAELQSCLKAALEETESGKQRVAIIVPDLAQRRSEIRRLLRTTPKSRYNLSAGNPLSEHAIIQSAVAILKLSRQIIDVETAYQWLQSPYLCLSNADINSGALLDAKLRAEEKAQLPLSHLFKLLPSLEKTAPSSWLDRLRSLKKTLTNGPRRAKPSELTQHWLSSLDAIGWPGGRALSSTDYQLTERFNRLLNEFATLDRVAPLLSATEAVQHLERQCHQTAFQPEGSTAPLQILGLLESAGLDFDLIWLTGTDEDTWPPSAKPNPFIPIPLQRQHNMPHASAERELGFSWKIFMRLLNSAERTCISWSSSKDKKDVQPSPFIDKLNLNLDEASITRNNVIKTTQSAENNGVMDNITDEFAPPLLEQESTRGGSRLIQLQSQCPFWAFAEMRLKAKPLQQPVRGISAAVKGNLVHSILETLWNQLGTQQQLISMPEHQLQTMIDETIKAHCQDQLCAYSSAEDRFYWQIEIKRLSTLIFDWFALEKTRGEFTVVAHELQQKIQIGSLTLNLKIDRIDQLPNGDNIMMDYKTGTTSVSGWFGDRPASPQLPMYCSFETPVDNIKGIAFAEIRPHQVSFKGVSAEATHTATDGINNITSLKGQPKAEDWAQQIEDWKQRLTSLSNEFSQGRASVTPLTPQTCQYCSYKSLCRIEP